MVRNASETRRHLLEIHSIDVMASIAPKLARPQTTSTSLPSDDEEAITTVVSIARGGSDHEQLARNIDVQAGVQFVVVARAEITPTAPCVTATRVVFDATARGGAQAATKPCLDPWPGNNKAISFKRDGPPQRIIGAIITIREFENLTL